MAIDLDNTREALGKLLPFRRRVRPGAQASFGPFLDGEFQRIDTATSDIVAALKTLDPALAYLAGLEEGGGGGDPVPGPKGDKGDTGADSTVPGPVGPQGPQGPQGEPGTGGGDGTTVELPFVKSTLLRLAGNLDVANSWKIPVNWGQLRDELNAYRPETPDRLVVPTGALRARATAKLGWSNSGGIKYAYIHGVVQGSNTSAGGSIVNAANESFQTIITPWVDVTPGDYFYLEVNSGNGGYLSGEVGNFGAATEFQVEFEMPIAVGTGPAGPEGPQGPPGADAGTQRRFTHWRVKIEATEGNAYALCEIELRDTPGGPDLAMGGSAVASNEEFGVASNAFDNNPSTFWATDRIPGRWVGYVFASPIAVTQIALTTRSDSAAFQAPTAFSVEGSPDGVNWLTAWQCSAPSWGVGETKVFTLP